MAKNEEETEEKTKDKSKEKAGFRISSKTYYTAAIIVLVIGAALIGYMAMGQPKFLRAELIWFKIALLCSAMVCTWAS